MSSQDQVSYGRRGRLRAALSHQAAEITDSARGLVPTYADGAALGGEFVQAAAGIAADARQLLELAVTYERSRGTSWEIIGEGLGITRQAAHDRFGDAVKRLDAELVGCWLLGDDPRYPGLPDGVANPAEVADILDRWVDRHLQRTDPLAHKPEADPERQRPVSHNLPPMDTLENSALIMTGHSMIAQLQMAVEFDAPLSRALELGLARRKIEYYERMTAEEADNPGLRLDGTSYADLLAAARGHLALLEFGAAHEKGPVGGLP
jgi:hypothetical protein